MPNGLRAMDGCLLPVNDAFAIYDAFSSLARLHAAAPLSK